MNKENKSEKEQMTAFFFLCLKNWYYFVISMVICGGLAYVYMKMVTPVWEIDARVSLTDDDSFVKSGSLSQSKSLINAIGMGGGSSQNAEDESKKMASEGYIKTVVKNLKLNKVYAQSEYWGIVKTQLYDQSPVIISTDPLLPDTLWGLLKFTIDVKKDDGADITLKYFNKKIGKYKISAFPAELETPFGKFTLSKSDYYNNYEKPFKIKALFTSYDYMAQIYIKMIEIDFEKKNSDLINLSINHENPIFAKQILNEIVKVYNMKWREYKDIVSDNTIAFIDERLKTVESDLGSVDHEMQNFKDQNNLTDIKANVTYYFEMNAELQGKLVEAETQLKLIDIIFDFVKAEDHKYSLVPFSTVTLDHSLADLIGKYNDVLLLRNDLHDNSSVTTSAIQSANKQIEAQRDNLLVSLANIKQGMKVTYAELKDKEKSVDSRINNIPSIERQYVILKREQEIQQTVYLFLVEKKEETMLKSISLMPKLKMVDDPYTLNIPVSPSLKKLALLVLLFGGFIFPAIAIYLIPVIQNYLRSRKK